MEKDRKKKEARNFRNPYNCKLKMCLFARNKDTKCSHEECKQFYKIMQQSKKESKASSEQLGKRSEPCSSIAHSENEKSFAKSNKRSQKPPKIGFEVIPNSTSNPLNTADKQGTGTEHQTVENNFQNSQQFNNNFMRVFMPQPYMPSPMGFMQQQGYSNQMNQM